jgi:hypothetical protein
MSARYPTLGDVAAHGQQLQIGCDGCKTVELVRPEETHLPPKMEVDQLQRIWACRTCGAVNQGGKRPVWVRVSSL